MDMKIELTGKKSFKTTVRGHQIKTDLPVTSGGDDTAPTPPELFVASLGACIGVYAISYLRIANLNSEDLSIDIDWDFGPNKRKLSKIHASITVPNADLGDRKKALLLAAEKCLLHNTLREYPDVKINISE